MGINLRDKIRGALIGTAIGDSLGAPLEGGPSRRIAAADLPVGRALRWTDDTQMMLDTAGWVASGANAPEDLLRRLSDGYEAALGYGHGTKLVLMAFRSGRPWGACPFVAWPDGSQGNGACARVAPVACRHISSQAMTEQVARMSSWVTHAHPAAIAGAVIQAESVRRLLGTEPEVFATGVLLDGIEATAGQLGGWVAPAAGSVRELVSSEAPAARVRAAFRCDAPFGPGDAARGMVGRGERGRPAARVVRGSHHGRR
ncbi:MAG: ADP-ribosylglycohydrolase family protein [Myxococcales bacterium]|nr:ADP-ribosylglycohydrolase family protein [Myxococcales bacterium]